MPSNKKLSMAGIRASRGSVQVSSLPPSEQLQNRVYEAVLGPLLPFLTLLNAATQRLWSTCSDNLEHRVAKAEQQVNNASAGIEPGAFKALTCYLFAGFHSETSKPDHTPGYMTTLNARS